MTPQADQPESAPLPQDDLRLPAPLVLDELKSIAASTISSLLYSLAFERAKNKQANEIMTAMGAHIEKVESDAKSAGQLPEDGSS